MNINLATIDFCPSGGGGEAVIRSLNVTENGVYRAPSGVDGYNPVDVQVSGGGSITPEEQAALDTLVNASKGMLYTNTLNQYESISVPLEFAVNSEYAGKLYDVDGETYFLYVLYLYKFNPDTLSFDKLGDFTLSSGTTEAPMWKDMTGRMYKGVEYALDLDAMTYTPISLDAVGYAFGYSTNYHSIWKGQYAVYNLGSSPQKFDEATQKFVSCTVTITEGYDVSTVAPYMSQYGVWYDGHYVWFDNGTMFELTEYEDHLDISVVSTPYFPMTINSESITCAYIRNVEGELYYLYQYDKYHLVNGSWESVTINFYFGYNVGRGTVCENYLVGCEGNDVTGYTSIVNMSASETKTYWTEPKQVAVDLNSDQYITGLKRFGTIHTDNTYFKQLVGNSSQTSISLNKNETTANSIKLSVAGKFTMNNKNIATTDECIINRTIIPYGDTVVDVLQYGKDPYKYNYFTTNGRLFYTSGGGYEFDGTQWNSVSTPLTDDGAFVYGTNVVKAGTKTFYVNGRTYLWDNTNSQFVTIVNDAPSSGWYIWPCGDGELRAEGNYKLVENNGTWSWEQDTVSDYKYGMTYYINGNVYVLGLNDSKVYQYDESTKTYTELGYYNRWIDSSFECAGEIFFPWNGESFYKIDLSKVGVEQYIDTLTNIPYIDYNYFYGEYNNYLYFYRDYDNLAYCYDVEESVPAIPTTDGTYTLKATVLNGQVTYSWVTDQV